MLKKIRFTLLDLVILIFVGFIAVVNIQEASSTGLKMHLIVKSKSELACTLLINKFSDGKYEDIDNGNTSGFFYRAITFDLDDFTPLLTERDLNNILFSFETDKDNEIYLYRLDFYKNGKLLASLSAQDLIDRIRLDDVKNKSLRDNSILISNVSSFNMTVQMSNITSAFNFYETEPQAIASAALLLLAALVLVLLLPVQFKKILTALIAVISMAYMENYFIVFNYRFINIVIITALCGALFLFGYKLSYSQKTHKIFYFLSIYFLGLVLYQYFTGGSQEIVMRLFIMSMAPVLDSVLIKVKKLILISFLTSVTVIFLVVFGVISSELLTLTLLPYYFLGRKIRGIRFTFTREENRYLPAVFLTFSGLFSFVFSALPSSTQNALLEGMIFQDISGSYSVDIYTPFLYIIFTSAALSGFAMLFALYKRRKNLQEYYYEIDFSNVIHKVNDYIFIFFFVIMAMYFSNWFVLEKMVHNFYFGMTSIAGLLNFYMLASVFFVLYSLFGKKVSVVLVSAIVLVIMIANFVKLHYLKEPFYPWEVYLVKEAFVIAKNYIGVIFYILVAVAVVAVLFLLYKNFRSILGSIGSSFMFSSSVLAVTIISLIFSNIFSTTFLYDIGLTNTEMNWKVDFEEFKENGLFFQEALYLKNIGNYMFTKPINYSAQAMQDIKDGLPALSDTDEKNQNIIVIMNESFFDLTQIKSLKFAEDITPTYKKFKKADLISSNFGGGTANVEFEMLTGFSNYFFSNIMAYSSYIKRQTPSIVSAFRDNGYDTIAIHPFHANFYRRDLVYDYLGFNNFIDITRMAHKDIRGEFTSDESVVDEIIGLLNKDDSKKFIFAVTMQNHGGYSPNRYGNIKQLFSTNKLTSAEAAELNAYAEGVKDADLSLKKLIDEVNASKQPTIIYFFGDHLPSLYDTLRKLGQINSYPISMYQNGLAIYSNYKEILPLNDMVTPNQMALKILKDSGISYPVYFNILEELYSTYPVLQNKVTSVDLSSDVLNKYRMIQYDLLIGSKYILKGE